MSDITIVKTRIKTRIGVVTSYGSNLTTNSDKGADLHKLASKVHDLAGGGKLYRQETVDALKSKIAEYEVGIRAAIATAQGDCPENTAFELSCILGEG